MCALVYVFLPFLVFACLYHPCVYAHLHMRTPPKAFLMCMRYIRRREANHCKGRQSIGANVFIVLHNPAEVWAAMFLSLI